MLRPPKPNQHLHLQLHLHLHLHLLTLVCEKLWVTKRQGRAARRRVARRRAWGAPGPVDMARIGGKRRGTREGEGVDKYEGDGDGEDRGEDPRSIEGEGSGRRARPA